MVAEAGGDGDSVGDEIHNDVSGHVDGPVFLGRDFENITVGGSFPKEAAAYYTEMYQRLNEQKRREEEKRNQYRKSLIAERPMIVLRLGFSVLWFIVGIGATLDDTTPMYVGVLKLTGLLFAPIAVGFAVMALKRNIQESMALNREKDVRE